MCVCEGTSKEVSRQENGEWGMGAGGLGWEAVGLC
jgi:hypothetical protein